MVFENRHSKTLGFWCFFNENVNFTKGFCKVEKATVRKPLVKLKFPSENFNFTRGFHKVAKATFAETPRKIEISKWKFQFYEGFPTVWMFSLTFAETPRKIEISMWKLQFYEGFPQSWKFKRSERTLSSGAHFPYTYYSSEPILDKVSFGAICMKENDFQN